MKKSIFFVAALLLSSMAFADVKVETFTPKSGGETNTYQLTVASRTCDQATWTVLLGGIKKNVGDFGSSEYSAIFRAKLDADTVSGVSFIESDSIADGIDSLSFKWNANGNETGEGKEWDIVIYINGDSVGAVTGPGTKKVELANIPTFTLGGLKIKGKFVMRFENHSKTTATSGNSMRFAFDNLTWTTYTPGEKSTPQIEFVEPGTLKKNISLGQYLDTLRCNSDGEITYSSSEESVATVAADGKVTFLSTGTTIIKASVAETAKYKAGEATYTLVVMPENWNMETFQGAENATGNDTYLTTATQSFKASEATGILWTTFLGSVRGGLGNFGDNAAVIRQRKASESSKECAYLVSDSIKGGIDSLAFRWNCNGGESGNWNIVIYINNDSIGAITESAPSAKYNAGEEPVYSIGGLKREGNFVLRIVNAAPIESTVTGNKKRFVLDNIEWYSYSTTPATGCEEAKHEAAKPVKVVKDGMLYIYKDGQYINVLGF